VLARLYLAWTVPPTGDYFNYTIAAWAVENGRNVYGLVGPWVSEDRLGQVHQFDGHWAGYNYTIVWAYVLAGLRKVARGADLPFWFTLRAFLTLVDTVNAALIGCIAARYFRSIWRGWVASGVALANPVGVILTGTHGQFENLAALPLLAAVWLHLGSRTSHLSVGRSVSVWMLAILALIVKHIWVFGVWTVLVYLARSGRGAQRLFILGALVFSATFLPFLGNGGWGILTNVIAYSSYPGLYGTSWLFPRPIAVLIFFLALGLLPVAAKERFRWPLPQAMAASGVAMIALIHGIGQQYFIIPLLFGGVAPSRWYWLYSSAVTLFLLFHFTTSTPTPSPLWQVVWLSAVAWLLALVWPQVRYKLAPGRLILREPDTRL
jgi:hypothetical protein